MERWNTRFDHLTSLNRELMEALQALLKFNEELCQDVGVSIHYPSAERARKLLARAQRNQSAGGVDV